MRKGSLGVTFFFRPYVCPYVCKFWESPSVSVQWTGSGPEVSVRCPFSGPEVDRKWTRSGPEVDLYVLLSVCAQGACALRFFVFLKLQACNVKIILFFYHF